MHRRNWRPTEADLASVTLDEGEVEAYKRNLSRMQAALERGRIPGTLDWGVVMVSLATQMASQVGMPAEALTNLADTIYDGLPPRPLVRGVPALGDLRARRRRVRNAVQNVIGTLPPTDVIGLLVHSAAFRFVFAGVPVGWFKDCIVAGMSAADALLEHVAKSRGFEA